MARILCVTGGLTGLLRSSLELARRLEAAGHDVTLASAPDASATVRAQDIRFAALDLGGYERFLEADSRGRLLDRLRAVGPRRDRAACVMSADGLADVIEATRPDLVLVDAEMHEQIIRAAATQVPVALLVPFVSIWRRPGLPPPHCLVRPGVGWRGSRAGIWLLWTHLRLRKATRSISQWIRRLGCDRVSLLRHLAHQAGFDLRREVDAGQWLIPFTYRRIPALCLHALEFEFPHTPAGGVHYVGPLIPEGRPDPQVSADTQVRLEAAFERRRSGATETLIYAGFGSFFSSSTTLVRRLVAAVAARPDWELVVSLGGQAAAAHLDPLPANTCVVPWAPQMDVLRHADVAVIHGGIGTVDECVVSGVPMLVYCGFETDMGGTTARVWHHGIGMIGDPRRDDPDTIGRHLERLRSAPQFRQNLSRLQAAYESYRRDRVAERVVEGLISGPTGTPPASAALDRP